MMSNKNNLSSLNESFNDVKRLRTVERLSLSAKWTRVSVFIALDHFWPFENSFEGYNFKFQENSHYFIVFCDVVQSWDSWQTS